jgi:hypothetical protein
MKFPVGTILHFNRFQFEEPATATRPAEKNKFFIVLRNLSDQMVLANLPTSKDKIPAAVDQRHGCVSYPSGNFTAYIFDPMVPIATNGWFFSLRTYMYGYQIRDYSYVTLSRDHGGVGSEVSVKGRLVAKEFQAMVQCMLRSIDLKRRYRRTLEEARYDEDVLSEPMISYGDR